MTGRTGPGPSTGVDAAEVRLAELMAALGLAIDIGMGQPMGPGAPDCLVAARLGRAMGLDEPTLAHTFDLALLRHVGCSAYAREPAGVDPAATVRGCLELLDAGDPGRALTSDCRYAHPAAVVSGTLATSQEELAPTGRRVEVPRGLAGHRRRRPVVAGARLDEDVGEGSGTRGAEDPPARPMTGPGDRRPPDDPAGCLGWYQRAWNDLDLDRILAAYATPCYVVKGGRVLHHRDDAAKARYFADLLDGNRRQGPHRWDLSDLEQRPLGRDGALVTVSWTCRRPDGSAIWEFLDSYLLASERGRWWIVGDVVHEEPQEEPP